MISRWSFDVSSYSENQNIQFFKVEINMAVDKKE